MKERGTQRITAAQGTHIKCGLVFDGEAMPQLFLSRLRRAILLQFERGTLDVPRIKNEWFLSQGWHTANGRRIIAWVLERLNTDFNGFVIELQQKEQAYADELFHMLQEKRPSFDTVIGRDFATNYARLLTPLWMLSQAIAPLHEHVEKRVKDIILSSMCTFSDMVDNGGPSQISKDELLEMMRLSLEHGEGYVLQMDNSHMQGKENALLNRWGYEYTGNVSEPWKPRSGSVHLANRSHDGSVLWFDSEKLLDVIKKRALREYARFPYTQTSFQSLLVRLGIAEKHVSTNKKYPDRNVWQERIGGKRPWRLKIATSLLYSDEHSEDSEGSEDSTSSNSSTGSFTASSQPVSTEERGDGVKTVGMALQAGLSPLTSPSSLSSLKMTYYMKIYIHVSTAVVVITALRRIDFSFVLHVGMQ